MKIICMEYTTLDACLQACRLQQALTSTNYYDDYDSDDMEPRGTHAPLRVWECSFERKYTQKVSISNGSVRVTKCNEDNSGRVLTQKQRDAMAKMQKGLWTPAADMIWRENGWWDPWDIEDRKMFLFQATEKLIWDLMHHLLRMQLLPYNTCI